MAKDKILAQVDSLLGEIDVKKKEAEIGVRNMSAGVDQLTKAKMFCFNGFGTTPGPG